ncbi:MAG: rane protein-like protein [Sphingomonas bacterium]|nr:rane protein-like protein [Sphingomonas bacterium]
MHLDRHAHRLMLGLYILCSILICAQLIYAFVGLNASSLWIDELWTGWLIKPAYIPSILARSVTDVHPPVYYLFLHFWTLLFGTTAAVMRAFSAVCAVLAVVALIALTPRWIGLAGRLFAGAIAVTSPQWLDQSQNARMYALGFLLGLWLALVALHALSAVRSGREVRRSTFAALAVSAFLFSFCHFYMFVAALGVLGFLAAASPRWPDRLAFAGIGAVLFVCMLAFIVVLLEHTEVPIQDTWFSNSPSAIIDMTVRGITRQVRLLPLAVLSVLMVAATILPRLRRPAAGMDSAVPMPSALLMMLFVIAFVIVAGIASSLGIAPNYSDRNVAVAAPFAWLGVAILVDYAVRALPRWAAAALLALLAAAIALHALEQWHRLRAARTEHRAASNYIRALPQCAGKPIPVTLKTDQPGAAAAQGFTRYRFAYYLPGYPLAGVGYRSGRLSMADGTKRLLSRREAGLDECPVLAMIADTSGFDIEGFASSLRRALDGRPHGAPARPIAIVPFPHYDVYGNRLTEAWVLRRP